MILQSLNAFYHRLEADPKAEVAPFGFTEQKISFCVVIESDGSLHQIREVGTREKNKLIPDLVLVPGDAKPSGAGINPCFLWDNPAYLLGFKQDDKKPERTLQSFEAFRERHLRLEEEIKNEEFSSVCRFLETWNPGSISTEIIDTLNALETGFGVFKLRGKTHYVHDQEAIQTWWKEQLTGEEASSQEVVGQCLITGETDRIAQLHNPAIKGISGAQSSGAKLVSFNCDAFESYGKSQSFNAPVSEKAAFNYCTALNYLLRDDDRRIQLGDTRVVFWTDQPSPAEDVFGPMTTGVEPEDKSLKENLERVLKQITSGSFPHETLGSPKTNFYLLGLSPNAARLSIRFWMISTVGEVMQHLGEHYRDLELIGSDRDPRYPPPYRLLRQTAREAKDIPPLLEGSLLRAIWSGGLYPDALYNQILRRIRADRLVNYFRAATLKAVLNRKIRFSNKRPESPRLTAIEKELPVSLDPDRPELAYQLGRLFAVLDSAQKKAIPELTDTIKDRYYSSASATPASVFPRLIRLNQHHLGKLRKKLNDQETETEEVSKETKPKFRGRSYFEGEIERIMNKIDDFPKHLNLTQQGLFAIGFYHQRTRHLVTNSQLSNLDKE
ncbi:CRISPR-associated protein Csd1 [Planctomycetales bacterium 10988]|nr:CRISPR-associated protein Csd1 [Planctomycetales bacterium 10988]